VKQTPTEKQLDEIKKAEVKTQKNKHLITKMGGIISMGPGDKEKDGWTMSCGTCCSYICCPHKVNKDERGVELKLLLAKIDKIEYMLQNTNKNRATNQHNSLDIRPAEHRESKSTSGYDDDSPRGEDDDEFTELLGKERLVLRGKMFSIIVA